MQTADSALAYGSATLHEAAGRIGALAARFKPAFAGARFAGPALPVLTPVGDNLWLHHAIYQAAPGDVLVVATTAPDEYGYWGEIMSEAAQARGLGGLVIAGGVRDTVELASVGFPVFSTTVNIRGTMKDPERFGSIGAPITLGDVTVQCGDLVVGDADGVVVIPADRIAGVLAAAAQRVAKEAAIIEQLRAGKTTVELYGLPSPVALTAAAPLVARLARLDTCAVSDAMESLGMQGAAVGIHAVTVDQAVAGRVITVELTPFTGEPAARHLGTAAIDAATPGDIIVIANGGRDTVSGWGGVLSAGATSHAVAAVITDGGVRDIDQAKAFGLPVYARGAVPHSARGRVVESRWNEPITVAGVAVAPGDYVIADGSGVVFVPATQADAIIAAAETIAAKEHLMAAGALAGEPMVEVMGRNYESMLMGDDS
jgi:4-hydroxy-4-methyl-2-oxoglutarate aldolase